MTEFKVVGKGFQEKIDDVKSKIEADKTLKAASSMLSLTLDLVEDKKTSKWTFWATDNVVKERWIINLILEPASRSVNEIRNDMRQLITEASRECLKKSDHLSEGFPNSFTLSFKISKN